MFAIEWVIGVGLACLLLGVVLGYVLRNLTENDNGKVQALEDALATAEEELSGYKERVYGQFEETARKFQNLSESYDDLHRHLAKGALDLCGEGPAGPLLVPPAGAAAVIGAVSTVAVDAPSPDGPPASAAPVPEPPSEAAAPEEAVAPAPGSTGATDPSEAAQTSERAEAAAMFDGAEPPEAAGVSEGSEGSEVLEGSEVGAASAVPTAAEPTGASDEALDTVNAALQAPIEIREGDAPAHGEGSAEAADPAAPVPEPSTADEAADTKKRA